MSDFLPIVFIGGLIAWFLYSTIRWLLSLVRPDLVTQWTATQGEVTGSKEVTDGWLLSITYKAKGQTYQVEGLIDKREPSPPTHVELVFQEKQPEIWDWLEDRSTDTNLYKDVKYYWFWILLLGGLIGGVLALAKYNPDLLIRLGERLY